MCPVNELTGVDFCQAVLAFRRQEAEHHAAEQFRLECEALKARQGHNPDFFQGLGWLRQQFAPASQRQRKAAPAPKPSSLHA